KLSPGASDEFVRALWAASDGVPFAVVEMARGGGQPAALSRRAFLPTTMTEQQRDAFAAAGVLGTTFDTDEFLGATTLPEEDGYRILDDGVALRLLVRTPTGFSFRHPLLRDALMDDLMPSRLHALHRRAAAALEALD